MKKGLTSLALAGLVSTSAIAKINDGLYVGGGVGVTDGRHRVHLDESSTSSDFTVDQQKFALAVLLGFGWVFDKFYVGGELDVAYSPHKGTADINVNATGPTGARVSVSTNFGYGAALRLGYLLMDCCMVFVRIGCEMRKFNAKVDLVNNVADDVDQSFTKVGIVPGIGFETCINEDGLTLGGEFRTARFGSETKGGGTTAVKVTPRVDTYLVTVRYNLQDKLA